ncbi:UNVERIFIED_ORG: putative RNA-binding protein with PUA-like domain [Buttiauxella agrestis ATCC 33320]
MNYWIFQCKKERFDISEPDILFDGMTGWWTANQYRSEMMPGDMVFFWLAGDKKYRGIYGIGELTSTPYQWEKENNKGFSVNIKCKKRLNQYLPVNKIQENRALLDLQILNMPMGSNFLLNKLEGQTLEAMTKNHINGDIV